MSRLNKAHNRYMRGIDEACARAAVKLAKPSAPFLVTCAIDTLKSPEISAWINIPRRRAIIEKFATMVLEGSLPAQAVRDAVAREVAAQFELKNW